MNNKLSQKQIVEILKKVETAQLSKILSVGSELLQSRQFDSVCRLLEIIDKHIEAENGIVRYPLSDDSFLVRLENVEPANVPPIITALGDLLHANDIKHDANVDYDISRGVNYSVMIEVHFYHESFVFFGDLNDEDDDLTVEETLHLLNDYKKKGARNNADS